MRGTRQRRSQGEQILLCLVIGRGPRLPPLYLPFRIPFFHILLSSPPCALPACLNISVSREDVVSQACLALRSPLSLLASGSSCAAVTLRDALSCDVHHARRPFISTPSGIHCRVHVSCRE